MAGKVSIERIGREGEPLVTLDEFAPDADRLRAAAMAARFVPGDHHYPGIRAPLPQGYLRTRMPVIAAAIGRAFGRCRRVEVVDASFSIVTTPPADLSLRQRVPHVDAFGRERLAMVHYLSPGGGDGTAFFRHRTTGFETVDAARAPAFFRTLDAEVAATPPPPAYVNGDTPLFERVHAAEAGFNRALLYRSFLLHSGAIAADAALSPDPATGRLTVTAFFAVE
ncbi:DUF6445 family protein [Sphingomonas aracearum]|uniref:Uncharacterized protein n=1 Tax=Sphingomonas aracearum TaxID=2283317 RepID=A0A369VY80_9SPHN|nr:DUF6445 family protein [Sphingomonas aracearum]RDE07258.1 hypothetical protein DVW87_06415 [Sphingomonas aracearum]